MNSSQDCRSFPSMKVLNPFGRPDYSAKNCTTELLSLSSQAALSSPVTNFSPQFQETSTKQASTPDPRRGEILRSLK